MYPPCLRVYMPWIVVTCPVNMIQPYVLHHAPLDRVDRTHGNYSWHLCTEARWISSAPIIFTFFARWKKQHFLRGRFYRWSKEIGLFPDDVFRTILNGHAAIPVCAVSQFLKLLIMSLSFAWFGHWWQIGFRLQVRDVVRARLVSKNFGFCLSHWI